MKKPQKKIQELDVQTDYGRHLCIFELDEKGFIVTVPGLQGVITWGGTLFEAKKMAKEAIELCIECFVEKMIGNKNRRSKSKKIKVAA